MEVIETAERHYKKGSNNWDYINQFQREAYDRITIMLPKGTKARLKSQAAESGLTLTEYLTSLIPRHLVGTWRRKDKEEEEMVKAET